MSSEFFVPRLIPSMELSSVAIFLDNDFGVTEAIFALYLPFFFEWFTAMFLKGEGVFEQYLMMIVDLKGIHHIK